jgi:hypothetical protein
MERSLGGRTYLRQQITDMHSRHYRRAVVLCAQEEAAPKAGDFIGSISWTNRDPEMVLQINCNVCRHTYYDKAYV